MCSAHFQTMLKENPIKTGSREEIVYYLCDLHNKVNEKLKKPIFDCKKAFGFWGGECGCTDKKLEIEGKIEGKDVRKDGKINENKRELDVKKIEGKDVKLDEPKIVNKILTKVENNVKIEKK